MKALAMETVYVFMLYKEMHAAIRRIIIFHIDFNKIEHEMNGINYECTIIHKKKVE